MRTLIRLSLLAGTLALSGCGQTRPWQREHLARIDRLGRDGASRSYEAHMWMVREGQAGGTGKPGGGCGCN